MTTAFAPFTTANAVSSIDLLRPSGQAPSGRGNPRRHHQRLDPGPTGRNHPHPARHHRRRALPALQEDSATTRRPGLYLAAVEIADPEQRDSLLQHLHQQHLTLTEWAANQAAPILTEIDRTDLRREYNARFGFPIITKAAVRWIAQATAGNPLLEIGAGNGYLASELINHGVDVIATDPHPPGAENGHRIPMAPVPGIEILPATGTDAMTLHPDHDILWSWPDHQANYTHQTLAHFGGRFLVYIGEDIYGNTGSRMNSTRSSKPTTP